MSALPLARDDAPAWKQFICRACGYIYDEKDGDPDGGLAPGTRYDEIPDDWACPLCGVSKRDFDPYDGPSTRQRTPRPAVRVAPEARRRAGVVIVGAGLAGWSVARALRSHDPDVPITMVAADSADLYSKPALSLAFGLGQRVTDLISSSGADAAGDVGIRLVPHTFATSIDAGAKRLRTTRGSFGYDALVLAIGARPLDAARLPADLCWRINALDTWAKLHAALASGPSRVVMIGAGLVGCELADDLAHAGHAVTVLDPGSRPLMAWASSNEAGRLLEGWERLGVRFVPSSTVVRMERRSIGGRTVTVIHSEDGDFHDADVVIAAIGLGIDPRLARTAGLATDAGIAVDATTLATSDPSIYAAGDCVSIDGRPCRFVEPIARQADAIAAAIAGRPAATVALRSPLVRLKTRSAPMTLEPRLARPVSVRP